ncbi:uracil-DNA glycosylase [Murdochiella massiliensis]|uniref:uracil-DNA glycosylase n=1 Tax=Murdochiella massiliensis TaxID=1673723 RepID=UPI000830FD5B|nr:uracil-DNA glycosylase [Murdochiella massiliensis]
MSVHIGNDWDELLADEWQKPYYQTLRRLLLNEYQNYTVYPPAEDIFSALRYVSFEHCRVVILGQDPYHEPRQANGLAFSVHRGVPIPPSLRNIYQELESDLGIPPASHGDLTAWAKRGVLLLNATLTVRAHQANSHEAIGWRVLTDRIISLLGKRENPLAFVLWGRYAQSKRPFITNPKDLVIASPHPSPLSAHRGFFGSRPFSRINCFYTERGEEPIDWRLPTIPEEQRDL